MSTVNADFELIHTSRSVTVLPITPQIHTHDYHQLAFIADGKGLVYSARHTAIMSRGDVIFVPSGVEHYFHSAGSDHLDYHVMSFRLTDPALLITERQRQSASITRSGRYLDYIIETFDLISRLESRQSDGVVRFGAALLQLSHMLFLNGSEKITSDVLRTDTERSLQQIYQYIRSHFQDRITLSSLAETFNMSPSSLSHLFTKNFGVSPIEFHIQSRLSHSIDLLVRSDMTIESVAYAAGYQSVSLYIRQFTSRFGCSPTEYRNRRKSTFTRPES